MWNKNFPASTQAKHEIISRSWDQFYMRKCIHHWFPFCLYLVFMNLLDIYYFIFNLISIMVIAHFGSSITDVCVNLHIELVSL